MGVVQTLISPSAHPAHIIYYQTHADIDDNDDASQIALQSGGVRDSVLAEWVEHRELHPLASSACLPSKAAVCKLLPSSTNYSIQLKAENVYRTLPALQHTSIHSLNAKGCLQTSDKRPRQKLLQSLTQTCLRLTRSSVYSRYQAGDDFRGLRYAVPGRPKLTTDTRHSRAHFGTGTTNSNTITKHSASQ